jgi:hypothetical protein
VWRELEFNADLKGFLSVAIREFVSRPRRIPWARNDCPIQMPEHQINGTENIRLTGIILTNENIQPTTIA